jgi:Zn-dependent protease
MSDVPRFVLAMTVVVMSCTVHEWAHVWSAYRMGDPTGKMEGRLTLNPLAHLDPFWTLILPFLNYFYNGFPLGGPKPAPVQSSHFRDPRLGSFWSSLAGPVSNLLLAACGLGILVILRKILPGFVGPKSYNALLLFDLFYINLGLALTNLIPVPPLDGSRVLHYLVGPSMDPIMELVDRSGWLTAIPIYLAFLYIAPAVLQPVNLRLYFLFGSLFGVGYTEDLFNTYTGK